MVFPQIPTISQNLISHPTLTTIQTLAITRTQTTIPTITIIIWQITWLLSTKITTTTHLIITLLPHDQQYHLQSHKNRTSRSHLTSTLRLLQMPTLQRTRMATSSWTVHHTPLLQRTNKLTHSQINILLPQCHPRLLNSSKNHRSLPSIKNSNKLYKQSLTCPLNALNQWLPVINGHPPKKNPNPLIPKNMDGQQLPLGFPINILHLSPQWIPTTITQIITQTTIRLSHAQCRQLV